MRKIILPVILLITVCNLFAQDKAVVVSKYATAQFRTKYYNDLVNNDITKNLSQPLDDTTEQDWITAFNAIELIQYKKDWIRPKFNLAFAAINSRSVYFQQMFLEMLFSIEFKGYRTEVQKLFKQTTDAKIFAICAEYLLMTDSTKKHVLAIASFIKERPAEFFTAENKNEAILYSLNQRINTLLSGKPDFVSLQPLFQKEYLKKQVVVYSIQRKNRNYPGLVIVKDTAGNFVRTATGQLFSVPQLARGGSNFPGYITNGNTPQGIFRMDGFDKSKIPLIGPTTNIQLSMPYEFRPNHFLKDSSIRDSVWTISLYKKLLPAELKEQLFLYETYYAGMAGRTAIIAHGTVVDPAYYKGKTYYPLTPTEGCLCTKEIWDANGNRTLSDQQKLADAIKTAGGADGYLIVVELDNKQKAVTLSEILPLLKLNPKK